MVRLNPGGKQKGLMGVGEGESERSRGECGREEIPGSKRRGRTEARRASRMEGPEGNGVKANLRMRGQK